MATFDGVWITNDGDVCGTGEHTHAEYARENPNQFEADVTGDETDVLQTLRDNGNVQVLQAGSNESITVALTRSITPSAFRALRNFVKDRPIIERIHFRSDQEPDIGQTLNRNAFTVTHNARALLRKISGSLSRVQRFHQ